MLDTERPSWSDKSGKKKLEITCSKLPNKDWAWTSDWQAVRQGGNSELNDTLGWEYAYDFDSEFSKGMQGTSFVRRRKWVRICAKVNQF